MNTLRKLTKNEMKSINGGVDQCPRGSHMIYCDTWIPLLNSSCASTGAPAGCSMPSSYEECALNGVGCNG
jgi:bacteriocin-like protein